MNNSDKKHRIIDLLFNQLTEEESQELIKAIDRDEELAGEFNKTKEIVVKLKELTRHQTPARASEKFDQWLQHEISQEVVEPEIKPKYRSINLWKYSIAASIVLLIGFLVGSEYNGSRMGQIAHEKSKQELLHLVSTESTTGRIEGINRSADMTDLDPETRDVLLSLLENDESTNVRLAALDALARYLTEPAIKAKLLQILKTDHQPIIQISIINALVKYKEPGVKETLEDLLKREELADDVKDEAILGMTRL